MRLLVNINVKSISNAITNSSSEVFLVKSKRPAEEIKELILAYSEMAYNADGIIDTHLLSPKIKRILVRYTVSLILISASMVIDVIAISVQLINSVSMLVRSKIL